MHPRCDHYTLPVWEVVQVISRCDSQHIAGLARECLTERLLVHKSLTVRVCFNACQVIPQIRVCVWHRVCKVNRILVILKIVGECQGVVAFAVVCDILSNLVLEIPYIIAILMPARILFFTLPLAVDRDFHSIVEKTVWLGVVQDVEPHS